MKIAFTGHRDKHCSSKLFDKIYKKHPDAVWIHGGAVGFDTDVNEYAFAHNIETIVIRPDYSKYPPKIAPIKRNILIVQACDILVALYDGRFTGGTAYTVNFARVNKKPVFLIPEKFIYA